MNATPLRRPRAPAQVRPVLARNEYASAQERERESLWWEKYASVEERFYWVLPEAFQPLARERYLQHMAEVIGPARHVIDYGCGNGWISRRLVQLLPARVSGLDFSAAQIQLASAIAAPAGTPSRLDFRTIQGPQDLPAADAYVFHGVLHHLPASEIHDLLGQVQRLAPRGARLIFVEPTCFPEHETSPAQQALLDRIAAVVEEPAAALAREGRECGGMARHVRETAAERWWGELPYGPAPLERPFAGDELSKAIEHYFTLSECAVMQYLPASQAVAGELTLLAEDAPELAAAIGPRLLRQIDDLEQELIRSEPLPDTGWYMQMLTATVR